MSLKVTSIIPKWQTFKLLRWVKLLNRFVDLYEILYACDDVEDDLDAILFNPVASTIPKWRTLKLLSWVKFLNKYGDFDAILCVDDVREGDLDTLFFIP
jgi:hypothetical protein